MIGVLTIIVSLQWYLALILIILEQTLENVVFNFNTMFIQPIPPNWDSEEWLGMVFFMPMMRGVYKLGMTFKNENFGREVFETIRTWNYNQDEDSNNNIIISFIIENNSEEYSTYIYPSFDRKSIKSFKEKAERELLKEKQMKEHSQLILTVILCKLFPYTLNSSLRLFKSHYRPGDTFEFGAYYLKSKIHGMDEMKSYKIKGGELKHISHINPVTKFHLKIKKRDELTEKDIEYQLIS